MYQSAVVFRQYQCVDDGLSSFASRRDPAVPGTMITGENAALLLLGISSKSEGRAPTECHPVKPSSSLRMGWTVILACCLYTLSGPELPQVLYLHKYPNWTRRVLKLRTLVCKSSSRISLRKVLYRYLRSTPRNLTPKKWDMNGHLISSILPDHNCMDSSEETRHECDSWMYS